MVPILIGMVAAFGLPTESRLGALMVITAAQSISIWNIGVQTAAAQNLVAVGFIQESMGPRSPGRSGSPPALPGLR